MFKLVIQDDEGKTTVVPLIRDEITIGRKEGNTIRLTERNVSRRHARILRNNGEVQIEDLGSYNGIRVNNARIAERVSLRISDQVQIGDYKLYLKAEGVEQVDDARTMPIERIEQGLPTEVMPAVPNTTPMPAPIAGTPPPNRSPVAVADTDPAGRPVATAAQVAALSQVAGYGKLVVVSSNFAGKEFDLTRPQMIVGRTDENDIVVNHRSISRNHAKVTRDPETGRYTISDLQSSNGVRVNGQDYGKVELRRGDTVDLGHVRLRFVEPGEDFVFARDAVIADVPETGGKKGLLVAIILGVVVLGAVGAFFAMKSGEGDKKTVRGSGDSGDLTGGSGGSQIVAIGSGEGPGSEEIVITPEGSNTETGSGVTIKTPTNDEANQIKAQCQEALTEKKWTDVTDCAAKLAKHDPAAAKSFQKLGKQELENDMARQKIVEAVNSGSLTKAKKELGEIENDSVYRQEAQKIDDLQNKVTTRFRDEALALKAKKDCSAIDKLVAKAKDEGGQPAANAVAALKCEKVAVAPIEKDCSDKLIDKSKACVKQFCSSHGGDPACSGGTPTVTPPAGCDPDALKDKGMENVNMGQHAAALAQFEASLRCKNDSYVLSLAFMASCNAGNSGKAKYYYTKLTTAQQTKYQVMCIRNKVPYQ